MAVISVFSAILPKRKRCWSRNGRKSSSLTGLGNQDNLQLNKTDYGTGKDDWIEYAREHAKAERELKIEKWGYISIEYRTQARGRIVLHTYDLPRELYERCSWIVR